MSAEARIIQLLEQIAESLNPSQLGVLDSLPGEIRVYCNRDRCPGALWYTLDDQKHPQALSAKAIRGYVRELYFEQVERRGKPVYKLYLGLDCKTHFYKLESGYDAVFSKGIIATIAQLDSEQLRSPLTIGVAPGDDESVLLARVWTANGQAVIARWDETTDWRKLSAQAIAVVKAANPE